MNGIDFCFLDLTKGYIWDQIKTHLISQGWDEKELEKIYKQTQKNIS
ncbi:hypothetical protein HOK76_08565 [archaeon]|jgi:hypothetical protein|nr:hypothetical protein [archaeon]